MKWDCLWRELSQEISRDKGEGKGLNGGGLHRSSKRKKNTEKPSSNQWKTTLHVHHNKSTIIQIGNSNTLFQLQRLTRLITHFFSHELCL